MFRVDLASLFEKSYLENLLRLDTSELAAFFYKNLVIGVGSHNKSVLFGQPW